MKSSNASDITNQQVLDGITDILQTMTEVMATKDDLNALADRLERKIAGVHTVNVKHHLETRAEIGYMNRKFDGLRSALAHAADPVD